MKDILHLLDTFSLFQNLMKIMKTVLLDFGEIYYNRILN